MQVDRGTGTCFQLRAGTLEKTLVSFNPCDHPKFRDFNH